MFRRPPRSTRTDPLFPYTPLFRSRLWRKVRTVEDPEWTRRFTEPAPLDKDHGARVVVTFKDGSTLEEEIAVADAHPRGAHPFAGADYIAKFRSLTDGLVEPTEAERFLRSVEHTSELQSLMRNSYAVLCLKT